ncbi:MAG: transglutaminase-like domain-containing protein [Syntrophorhabdaceae bacterium]|nr:transglutaminase-like domain-containing protein [Syntrophorhabdaceae bacterium]
MKRKVLPFFLFVISITLSFHVYAKTLLLEGRLEGKINVTQQMNFTVSRPLNSLSFRFAIPVSFSNKTVNQGLKHLDLRFEPQPTNVEDEKDAFGNNYKRVTWNNLNRDARVMIIYETSIKSELSAMESRTGFPLKSLPSDTTIFLKPTKMVQSDAPEIVSLSRQLTQTAETQYQAVTAIMNYIADNIKYTYNPPQYDAVYTLKTKTGNCQNLAHLSMALLRAAGIPARIVGGITLKDQWKVPLGGGNYSVQGMGQGGHVWIEIFFPDLGWLSYDPQQSKQFTSTRHIKQTHGLDSRDVNDSWRASPYVPDYNELIDAKFIEDNINLVLKSSLDAPRTYIVSNNIMAPPVKPVILPPTPELPPPPTGKMTEFGNMEFPNLVNLYQIIGDRAEKIMDKETAEYVTSHYVYAQAFKVAKDFDVYSISLAMRKFGGDGSIYIDLVTDENNKPNILSGVRSNFIPLETIKKRPGYYWVEFTFPTDTGFVRLKKGKYWIVLRRSGEAIMNWFYTPGKHYGNSDDTRSTSKGYRWEDILNYDFVFKVKGIYR